MLRELESLGNGDPMPLFNGLTQTASALMQLMPKQDEAQHLTDVLTPPQSFTKQQPEQTNEQDNYNNVDLAPRPGR